MTASIASVAAAHAAEDAAAARWRGAFWALWLASVAIRCLLAFSLAPFGDEAWYWQESRALALSYSDLPVATAWLIHIGESLFGHGLLSMRAPFLLLGAAVPLVLASTATRLFGARCGSQTGLLSLGLPLLGTIGAFALPDVPLTLCTALALDAFERCARNRRTRDWLLLGTVLAIAWLCHYRAAMLMLSGLVFLVATPRGRALWRDSGLWLAMAVSVLGLIPLLAFNVEHHWVAFAFQLIDRNPWVFHADGLVQPIEQAIVCTPPMYAILLIAAWTCTRRDGAPWDLLGVCALVPILGYLVLGCFADATRLRLHWPLPGYLPLLIALPPLLQQWLAPRVEEPRFRRYAVIASCAVLFAGCTATCAYFAAAAIPAGAAALARVKAFPEHWVGWNEVADETRRRLKLPRYADALLVADNFMLAAELDFALGGTRPVYTLDHPVNAKHGRSAQLTLWGRDEAALDAIGGRPILLVVEPTARRERERAGWIDTLCTRAADLAADGSLDLYAGRKRYLFFSGKTDSRGPADRTSTNCAADVK